MLRLVAPPLLPPPPSATGPPQDGTKKGDRQNLGDRQTPSDGPETDPRVRKRVRRPGGREARLRTGRTGPLQHVEGPPQDGTKQTLLGPPQGGEGPLQDAGGRGGGVPGWMVPEHVEPASGYSFDIFVPEANLVIEVHPNLEQISRSRPGSGFDLSHFQCKSL